MTPMTYTEQRAAIKTKIETNTPITHDEFIVWKYMVDYDPGKWAWCADAMMDIPDYPGSDQFLIKHYQHDLIQLKILTVREFDQIQVAQMVKQANGNLQTLLVGKELIRTRRSIHTFLGGVCAKGAVGVILIERNDEPFVYIPGPKTVFGKDIFGTIPFEHYERLDEDFTTEARFIELYDMTRVAYPSWVVGDLPVTIPGQEGYWRVWKVFESGGPDSRQPVTIAAVPFGTHKPSCEPRLYGKKLKGDTYTYINLTATQADDLQMWPDTSRKL